SARSDPWPEVTIGAARQYGTKGEQEATAATIQPLERERPAVFRRYQTCRSCNSARVLGQARSANSWQADGSISDLTRVEIGDSPIGEFGGHGARRYKSTIRYKSTRLAQMGRLLERTGCYRCL